MYWKNRYEIISNEKIRKRRKINTWDFQSTFSMWMKDGLAILPQKNLITNIGFGEDSTHQSKKTLILNTYNILPLVHNCQITHDKDADLKLYKSIYYKPLWKYYLWRLYFFIYK